jgi:PKD domain/Beta-propeller repeat
MKNKASVAVAGFVVIELLMTVIFPMFCAGANEKIVQESRKDPSWQWASSGGGSSLDYGYDVAVDSNGNTFIVGTIFGFAVFGSTSLTTYGGTDIYVAKLDADGVWQWAVNAGGILEDKGSSIGVDDAGNCYITGVFYDVAHFGNITLSSLGGLDVFVAKIDTNGVWQWAERGGGFVGEAGYGIAVDSAGNSYVTGHFMWSATFGTTTLSSQGFADVFVATLDTTGVWGWAVSGGGASPDYVYDIALDGDGNIILTGDFEGTATFGTETVTSLGDVDVFIAKLDRDGVWMWARSGGSPSIERGYDIAVDSTNNVYVAGVFLVAITFENITLSCQGNWDVYVVKFDGNGDMLWLVGGGGSATEGAWGITVDSSDNPYISGVFEGPVTFGESSLECAGYRDVFVAKLDSDGNWLWALSAGGTEFDEGYALTTDETGDVYVTGYFAGSALFGDTTLSTQGEFDVFIARLSSEGVNQPPIADFSYSPEKPVVGQTVSFDASLSYDPDGDIVSYEWDFGDETAGNGKTVDHEFSWSDSFVVSLTVRDRENAVDTLTKTIEVSEGENDLNFSITGGIGVSLVITNIGTEDASDVPWLIRVDGGLLGLIQKVTEGSIDVSAGSSATVKTGLFLGIGPFVITARVGALEKTGSGMQIIVFSMIKDQTW